MTLFQSSVCSPVSFIPPKLCHANPPREGNVTPLFPWTEEPGGLQSTGSQRVRQGSDTTERLHFHFSLSCLGEGNGNPLQCSCLENPRDRGAWWAAVYGVGQGRAESDRTEVTQQQQQQPSQGKPRIPHQRERGLIQWPGLFLLRQLRLQRAGSVTRQVLVNEV